VVHAATLLAAGKVLVTGGTPDNNGNPSSVAELFNPATNASSTSGNMVFARTSHAAVLLNDGTVLLAGGDENGLMLNCTELYDPAT
jgi:hypothetical protein